MPTPQKKEIWKVVLAIEPSLLMGITNKNGHSVLGRGDLLYNYLNYLLKTELREPGVSFSGVELLLWKGKNDLMYLTPDQITDTVHDAILGFAKSRITCKPKPDFSRYLTERTNFVTEKVSPLCTGKAINLALDKLQTNKENTKTLLFFLSDDPDVFSPESMEGLNIKYLPTLTVFMISEEAAVEGCSIISEFGGENGAAAVYDIYSWHRDFFETLRSNNLPASGKIDTEIFNTALKQSFEKKRGVCYAIHGLIKDALGIIHSHGGCM